MQLMPSEPSSGAGGSAATESLLVSVSTRSRTSPPVKAAWSPPTVTSWRRSSGCSRFHGVNRDAWSRYGKVDSPRYETVLPGWKYNLSDLQAGLGIHQLAKLDDFIERRTRLANLYHTQLTGIDGVNPLGESLEPVVMPGISSLSPSNPKNSAATVTDS